MFGRFSITLMVCNPPSGCLTFFQSWKSFGPTYWIGCLIDCQLHSCLQPPLWLSHISFRAGSPLDRPTGLDVRSIFRQMRPLRCIELLSFTRCFVDSIVSSYTGCRKLVGCTGMLATKTFKGFGWLAACPVDLSRS